MRNKKLCAAKAWPLLCLGLFANAVVHAGNIEAEGVASVERGGVEHARRIATEDAVRQASLRLGAVVVSAEQMSSGGELMRSAMIRPAAEPSRYAVVREWSEGGNLHVQIRAEERGNAPEQALAQPYKKKILITPFTIGHPGHVSDMGDAANGIARDLSQRLASSGRFLPKLTKYVLPQAGNDAPSSQVAAQVTRMALENDAQFVLVGKVINAGTTTDKGLFSSKTTRWFEVATTLYDGLTGTMIAERHFAHSGEGDMHVSRERPFGSAAFFTTGFGKVVDSVLDSAVAEAVEDVAPLPFTARIVRIDKGKVTFDAGATSALRPGDNLVAYSKKLLWEAGDIPQRNTGIAETPVGTVSVMQVHPGFSIGELTDKPSHAALKVGDYVRFDSTK